MSEVILSKSLKLKGHSEILLQFAISGSNRSEVYF